LIYGVATDRSTQQGRAEMSSATTDVTAPLTNHMRVRPEADEH
jgi:hypothetical protein